MADPQGWISIYRKLQNHWLWETEKPFDKRSAWIDILLMVNHKPGKVFFNNEIVEVDTGERITSEVKLAEKWGWSRTKVRTFLKLLEQDDMIENIKENGKRTRLKVRNYSKYQGLENNKKTGKKQEQNNTKTGAKQERNTNNNDNNDINENNDNNNIVPKSEIDKIYNSLSDYWQPLFKDYIDIFRQKNKTKKITDNKHLRLLKELKTIFKHKSFKYDGQNYNLTDQVFEKGIDAIVEKQIDNLNYAKQVWISEMEKAKKREDRKKKKREKVRTGSYEDKSGVNDENYKYKDFFIDFDKYKE